MGPAGALVGQFIQTMVEFPPRQSPASWSPEQMLEKLRQNEQAIKAAAHPCTAQTTADPEQRTQPEVKDIERA